MIQAPREDLVSPLVTSFEGAQQLQLRGRGAIAVSEHIHLEHILGSIGHLDRCFDPNPTQQCEA